MFRGAACRYSTGGWPEQPSLSIASQPAPFFAGALSAGRGLVLTHVLEQIDQPGVRERIAEKISEIYDGNVIWGEDLMEVPTGASPMAKME